MAISGTLRHCLLCVLLAGSLSAAQAQTLEEIWNKYAPGAAHVPDTANATARQESVFPGRILGEPQGEGESAFQHAWKYRSVTYELHYADPERLARSVYGLAIHARDVSPELPREKFFGGVRGFHYATWQICRWLDDARREGKNLSPEEAELADMLVQDGVIRLESGCEPGTPVRHVLGAAPGKKRSFARSLRHERLHVYWDEDIGFQARSRARWIALPDSEKEAERRKLKNYSQDNEWQLIEEWAVSGAEAQAVPQ